MKEIKYVKCPRCDINYMKSTDKYCDVCVAELARKLTDDEGEDDDRILCPVCNKNYIELDDEMCPQCLAEKEEVPIVPIVESDEDWRAYLDDDKDIVVGDDVEISLSELENEEEEEVNEDVDELADDLVDVFDDLEDSN